MIIAKSAKTAIKMYGEELLHAATPRQLLNALIKQNPDLMVEYCIENQKEAMRKFFIREQHKPIGFDNLEFRFLDMAGKAYYGFPPDMPVPIERFGKMRDFLMWMTVGVSPEEFDMIYDAMDKSWIDTLKTKKNHQRIGLLLQELKLRKNMTIHTELLYNFLAVQWIREDENPEIFDSEIQDQKVRQFKIETREQNTYFFFHQPELKRLKELLEFTQAEWLAYWNESVEKQAFLRIAIKSILSEIESEGATKTSTQA